MLKNGLNTRGLKFIAATAMLIDHFAATVLTDALVEAHLAVKYTNLFSLDAYPPEYRALVASYCVARLIGRTAFPIFCFLASEGYHYTKSVPKYLARLLTFAIISEIPFDYAFFPSPFYADAQNVLFTLALGVAAIWGYDLITDALKRVKHFPSAALPLVAATAPALCAYEAYLLKTDYSFFGVILVFIFGALRTKPRYRTLAAFAACAWEHTAVLALIPIGLYNGEKGREGKYTFYVFYPAHMVILKLIAVLISKISA